MFAQHKTLQFVTHIDNELCTQNELRVMQRKCGFKTSSYFNGTPKKPHIYSVLGAHLFSLSAGYVSVCEFVDTFSIGQCKQMISYGCFDDGVFAT